MKIKKSVLVDALKVLGKVVSQTSPVEVQRSVRLLGVGEQVWMTATDGVESVTVEVTGNAGEMEVFTVEYKALRELIRSTRVEPRIDFQKNFFHTGNGDGKQKNEEKQKGGFFVYNSSHFCAFP